MTSDLDRELFIFLEFSGISVFSYMAYNAGMSVQGAPLGFILFFCPPALYSLWLVKNDS
jgi:hypothetical protein